MLVRRDQGLEQLETAERLGREELEGAAAELQAPSMSLGFATPGNEGEARVDGRRDDARIEAGRDRELGSGVLRLLEVFEIEDRSGAERTCRDRAWRARP
jgi:hypothetical protein